MHSVHILSLFLLSLTIVQTAHGIRPVNIERQALRYVASADFLSSKVDRNCSGRPDYRVYLIDNFDQKIPLIPEIKTSHGKLLRAILQSGRKDISIVELNTSLLKGLSQVIIELASGSCADAVVSAIPGSNYSYSQTSSLLDRQPAISESNILGFRDELLARVKDIAFHGFPSVDWLLQLKVNPVKLLEDTKKIALIEALGRFGVPVFLPYGNADTAVGGTIRNINLLSLASNAKVYSGRDAKGQHLVNYPYSPLSSGDEQARFDLIECPVYEDAAMAKLDINDDGYWDFSYRRDDFIAYYDSRGEQLFAPPLISSEQFKRVKENVLKTGVVTNTSLVLTSEQYRQIISSCQGCDKALETEDLKDLVWLNSERYGTSYTFNAQCRKRGTISGSSLIPPAKVKELLIPVHGS